MKNHPNAKLELKTPQHWLRGMVAIAATAAIVVAGHFAWRHISPQQTGERVVTRPATADRASLDLAAEQLKASKTTRR